MRDHFWFRSRNKLVIWVLDTYCQDASSLLDVGCGTGFVLQAIRDWSPEIELLGSDLSAEALEIARELVPTATFIQRDAQHLEPGKEFDVVCAFDVLEHLDDDEGALVRIAAASRLGGRSSSTSLGIRGYGARPTTTSSTAVGMREARSKRRSGEQDSLSSARSPG